MKDLAGRLLEVLIKKGEGRGAFAQKAGISPAVLSHIASGRNAPSLELVLAILRIYPDVSPDWLLMGKGTWNRQESHPTGQDSAYANNTQDLFSSREETHTGTNQELNKTEQPSNAPLIPETEILMKRIEELRFLLKLHAKNAEDSISELETSLRIVSQSGRTGKIN